MPVAYGINRQVIYYTKALIIFLISLLFYILFVAAFLIIEVVQSGYSPDFIEIMNILGWTVLCGFVLTVFESIIIFLCVLIQNIGVVIGDVCSK